MNLLQTETPRAKRYYLDGRRIDRERVDDLKATHDQDCFQTSAEGDVVRKRSCLRPRTRVAPKA